MNRYQLKGLAFSLSLSLSWGINATAAQAVTPGWDELPPGRLKDKISTLPDAAQQQALQWLKRFAIPAEDFESIDVDAEGGIYYIEPIVLQPVIVQNSTTEQTSLGTEPVENIGLDEAFSLHSKPGAGRTIYLDFDGHVIEGTAWNGSSSAYHATPYDRDGNLYAFSQSELNDIAAIWHRLADDFAMFDVDVTTEAPIDVGPNIGRILVTRSTDANGQAMPSSGAGGVAYVGVWGRSNYGYYQPALVYYNNLGGGLPRYVVEAASHEMGHNLGLSHDGTTSGSAYYSGQGTGYTRWAPIMGTGYNAHVSQWSKGDYQDANNHQDDIGIITNQLSNRPDDHGNLSSNATLLSADALGNVVATNSETDPYNFFSDNKGIIETVSDIDVFQINASSGQIALTIVPAWDAFLDAYARGANLDIQATLRDEQGTVLAVSNPVDDTYAEIQVNVVAGAYYLEVTGVGRGSAVTTYDDYGSQGQYYIRGVIPVSESGNQSPIAQNDSVTGEEDSDLLITPLANDSDPDEDPLFLSSVSNGSFGNATVEGNTVRYSPSPNQHGTDTLTYDVSDGKGGFATGAITIVVTSVNDAPVGVDDSSSTEQDTSLTIDVLANDTDVDGDSLSILNVGNALNGQVSISGGNLLYTPDTGFSGADSFNYTLQDEAGSIDSATVNVTVTEKLDPPVTPTNFAAVDGNDGTAQLSWFDTDNETSFEIQRESKHKKRNSWNGTSFLPSLATDTTSTLDNTGTGTFRYRIRSLNDAGASSWSNWTEVTVTSEGGSSGGGGKGGNGKGPNK